VDAAKSAGEIIRKGFHEKKNVEHKGQDDSYAHSIDLVCSSIEDLIHCCRRDR